MSWVIASPAAAGALTIAAASTDLSQSADNCPATVRFQVIVTGNPGQTYEWSLNGTVNTSSGSSMGNQSGSNGPVTLPSSGSMTFLVRLPIQVSSSPGDSVTFAAAPGPGSAGATYSSAFPLKIVCPKPEAPPTKLRPVQQPSECAALPDKVPVECNAAIAKGELSLVWDDSTAKVTEYELVRVDGGRHDTIEKVVASKMTGSRVPRWAAVSKPSDGYDHECFAVRATSDQSGSHTSADSERYCYASGATAKTETLAPVHALSLSHWTSWPNPESCAQTFVSGATAQYGNGFTTFFPTLAQQLNGGTMEPGDAQLLVGSEWVFPYYIGNDGPCTFGGEAYAYDKAGVYRDFQTIQPLQVYAESAVDFDLSHVRGHKIYSARLSMPLAKIETFEGGQFIVDGRGWCPTTLWPAAAARWWESVNPNSFIPVRNAQQIEVHSFPGDGIDVADQLADLADHDNNGFVFQSDIANQTESYLLPGPDQPYNADAGACVLWLGSPRLTVTYF
jgi:hypothetical protein